MTLLFSGCRGLEPSKIVHFGLVFTDILDVDTFLLLYCQCEYAKDILLYNYHILYV